MFRSIKFVNYGLLAVGLVLVFIYGVGVGAYQWFPYSLLLDAKNALSKEYRGDLNDQGIIYESLRDDTEYYVVLLAGQSNMLGLGDVSALDKSEQQLPVNIKYFNFGREGRLNYQPQKFGPEVSFSHLLHESFPDKHFAIIKYAIGSSSLLDWSPDWSYEKARITGHPHYGPLYEDFMDKVRRITGGKKVKYLGLLWMQGEKDATYPEVGKEYYKNLSAFLARLRSDLNRPDLPVLLGRINPPLAEFPAVKSVRSAQEEASQKLTNVYLVDADGLDKLTDDLHYNTEGQLELGRRFAQSLKEVIAAQPNTVLDANFTDFYSSSEL